MKFPAALAIFTAICFSQTRIATVEGITEYRLDNGLKVLLFQDRTRLTATVNITYMVGSRVESYGETGMAHLLEHLVFKSTSHRTSIKIELSDHGARFNGTTSYDRTNYFETLDAGEQNLRWALEMEADRMVNARIAKSDLDSEMSVVRNELERGENHPIDVLEQRVFATAYLWHSYGRTTVGAPSDIENVPIENLQAFYRKYYQPDNAMIVVAGNFDEAKALAFIRESFGPIPRPARKLSSTYTREPTQDGEREVTLRRAGDFQAVMMAYHIPAGPHPDSAAMDVLSEVLRNAPAGRLYRELVASRIAIAESGYMFQLHDPGIALFIGQVRSEGSLDAVEKIMLATIEGVRDKPPAAEEVERARAHLLKDIGLMLNDSEQVGIYLSEWESMGDWRLLFLQRDRIQAVQPEDVARVARLYLKISNRTLGRFLADSAPDRAEIPATPDMLLVSNYKGKADVELGEAFDPSPANIDAHTLHFTLANGMKLSLLAKRTRGASVNAVLTLHYGDQDSLSGKEQIAQVTGQTLLRGAKNRTRQQIQDDLDHSKAQLSVSASAIGGVNVSINTVRPGLADTLRLAALVLREPALPDADLEQIRQSSLGRVEQQRGEPAPVAVNSLNRYLNPYAPGDPRSSPTIEESIAAYQKLTAADIRKFHEEFYGASHAELAVVGDFDPAAIRQLAEELFGNWTSPAPYSAICRSWRKLQPVNRTIDTPDKANAFFAAAMTFDLNESDADYPALLFANTLIGGGSRSHLWLRIRENEGLSYAVQSVLNAGAADNFGQFLAIAIANPSNIARVEASFKDEMAKIMTDGLRADEVAAAKKAFLQQRQMQRADDEALARQLARNDHFGWSMARQASEERKISELSAEEVSAALRRHLDPAALVIFKAGDFKKPAETR